MKLHQRLTHVLRKPPRVITWKVAHRALRQARRFGYWPRLARQLAAQIHQIPIEELRSLLYSAPQLLQPGALHAAARAIATNVPEEASALIADANRTLGFEFSYLGWTRRFDALPLPWTSDWSTGRVWDSGYYGDFDYSEPHLSSDVKSCWEPSRFHFGVRLGQAYRLTDDTRYRAHFFALVRDWLDSNPFARSVNWISPLEVGIRGVNLAAALSLFSDASETDFRQLVELIAVHGAFLFRNIEYTDVRGNHYTGNLLGLLTMGLLLERVVPEAAKWRRYAEERVSREILLQYHPDGVNFEKSVAYHRFVTEMFLLSDLLLERAQRPMFSVARERLRLAAQFTAAYTRPDGRAPIIGDNDDARALPLSTLPPADHRHLLALSSLLHDGRALRPISRQAWTEALWLSGGSAPTKDSVGCTSAAFPAGGFYVARHGSHYLMVDAGHVGLQSGGCHGHHDMLSFELAMDGVPIIVDAGSPAYTGDVAAKNRYRRTAAHNTARIDGAEQGSFDPSLLWHLGAEALPLNVHFEADAERAVIEAAHVGYMRLKNPVMHTRRLELHGTGLFEGMDTFTGPGEHEIEVYFHFHEAVSVTSDGTGRATIRTSDHAWCFAWTPADTQFDLLEGEVSPSYGIRKAAPMLCIRRRGTLPWSLHYRMGAA